MEFLPPLLADYGLSTSKRELFLLAAVMLPIEIHPEVTSAGHDRSLGRRPLLLLGGPRLGPAVLFWSLLQVIILVAVGLSRLPLTPLGLRDGALHRDRVFGLLQILLAVWTLAALAAINQALLGPGHADPQ